MDVRSAPPGIFLSCQGLSLMAGRQWPTLETFRGTRGTWRRWLHPENEADPPSDGSGWGLSVVGPSLDGDGWLRVAAMLPGASASGLQCWTSNFEFVENGLLPSGLLRRPSAARFNLGFENVLMPCG